MTELNCWDEIKKLSGRTLKTLDQRKPFEVVYVSENSAIVLPLSTKKERPIQRIGIENAYRRLVVTGRLASTEIEAEFAPRNPVYVSAMLAEIPGVDYKVKPIVLRTKR